MDSELEKLLRGMPVVPGLRRREWGAQPGEMVPFLAPIPLFASFRGLDYASVRCG